MPVFLLPRGKSPSPPPPPHFCHPRPSIPPPTCTCSPAATARSPVATHLFVLPALAGDVSFQFIPPLRSVLPTFRQADKPESWKAHHPRRPRRPEPPPAHRQRTASARARPPASPHSPSIHPRSPVTYRSSSSHPRLRLTRRVNRQTLRPLLTSATHPCPARAPGESSTCPRNPPPQLLPPPARVVSAPRARLLILDALAPRISPGPPAGTSPSAPAFSGTNRLTSTSTRPGHQHQEPVRPRGPRTPASSPCRPCARARRLIWPALHPAPPAHPSTTTREGGAPRLPNAAKRPTRLYPHLPPLPAALPPHQPPPALAPAHPPLLFTHPSRSPSHLRSPPHPRCPASRCPERTRAPWVHVPT